MNSNRPFIVVGGRKLFHCGHFGWKKVNTCGVYLMTEKLNSRDSEELPVKTQDQAIVSWKIQDSADVLLLFS